MFIIFKTKHVLFFDNAQCDIQIKFNFLCEYIVKQYFINKKTPRKNEEFKICIKLFFKTVLFL